MFENKFKVAIVGSGPSGFYCADHIIKQDPQACVDIFEKLPFPYGLVRYGVAPDHQSIKNVEKLFEKTALYPNVRFFGNVAVGQHISVAELRQYYHAIIFAYGAACDKKLGITGEHLKGVHSATDFVAWYNGHPDFKDMSFDLKAESVAVIGQGNVAVDVCRILLKSVEDLKKTDITDRAIEILGQSKIKTVYLIGRRGPVQASFTEHELKEICHLDHVKVKLHKHHFELNASSELELQDEHHKKEQKNWHIFQDMLSRPEAFLGDHHKTLDIRFFMSPEMFIEDNQCLSGAKFTVNHLTGDPFAQRVLPTDESLELKFGLCFESIGYFGKPIEGISFDEKKGIIPNDKGRILIDGSIDPRLYTAGWIKRGPQGVIGTNRMCSHETVDMIFEQRDCLLKLTLKSLEALISSLKEKSIQYVTFENWKKLDAYELQQGQVVGKVREKITCISKVRDLI